MKSRRNIADADAFPGTDALAALRSWYEGLSARQAVERYLGARRATGQSSRAMLGSIRRQLVGWATKRHRADLGRLLEHPASERVARAKAVVHAIETIRLLPLPAPAAVDSVDLWVSPRAAAALKAAGIKTLTDVATRSVRRRRWWSEIPGLGARSVKRLLATLEQQPQLFSQARALAAPRQGDTAPWERLVLPLELDGTDGAFRAPPKTCTLSARNDFEAVNAWLNLHETRATVRSYRKEVERLVQWAVLERGKPFSSLTTDDAIAYRSFLRRPSPRHRWVGPARPRSSAEWRPFQGDLSARSVAYALSVISALFRWLVEQRYALANPFAGVKVKGAKRSGEVDTGRALTGHEWALVRPIADLLDLSLGWSRASAQRLRFMLDFWFATGLRPSELVGATLGNIDRQPEGDSWLHVVGKGDKPARVALPTLATHALERYLADRRLPVSSPRWDPSVPLLPSLADDGPGITTTRLWAILRRFFSVAAQQLQEVSPPLADKLKRATPHWMRHTHATFALAAGAELTTVRDNLRHASIATTSVYLSADDRRRARQLRDVFQVAN